LSIVDYIISCYPSKLDILLPKVLTAMLLGNKINCVTADLI